MIHDAVKKTGDERRRHLFCCFGRDKYIDEPEELEIPRFTPESLEWLVEYGMKLMGVDLGGIELSHKDARFAKQHNHHILMDKGIPLIENLAHLSQLTRSCVQRYVPFWEQHPGQPEAGWGVSSDRPVHSLVGVVSRDSKHLAAWGCSQCSGIGQGWHDCLHLLPDLSLDYDAGTNRIVSRGVFYFMENEPDKLLARYKADFSPVHFVQ